MSEEWIYIEHPNVDGAPAKVTMSAFVNLHEDKGWVAVEDPTVVIAETPREASARVHKGIKKTAAKKAAAKK